MNPETDKPLKGVDLIICTMFVNDAERIAALEKYARNLEARCEADASLDKAVEVKRYNLAINERAQTYGLIEHPEGEVMKSADVIAAMRSRAEGVPDAGRVWSMLRNVLEQGSAIQQDYTSGKYESYEHYAARVDEAARERADQFMALIAPTPPKGTSNNG